MWKNSCGSSGAIQTPKNWPRRRYTSGTLMGRGNFWTVEGYTIEQREIWDPYTDSNGVILVLNMIPVLPIILERVLINWPIY
ncbi:ORF136 [White spot syndrome virus]|uniref:ORF136 n=1 Tax=White spot syndrome virus TaxID=342409 RepID=A0A2D3I5X4_9VIRU|nr:ORF136 [White spot syndrome virus]